MLYRPTYKADGAKITFKAVTLFRAAPAKASVRFFPWYHVNGKPQATQGVRLETAGKQAEYVTVLYPGTRTPPMSAVRGGVGVGDDEVVFAGGIDETPDITYVLVRRKGRQLLALRGKEIDLDRFQGKIGLFVPDAGYPFGEMPNWLLRQRAGRPEWYPEVKALGIGPD